MKFLFILGFLLIFHMHPTLGAENVDMEEMDSDVSVPLISHTDNIVLKDIKDDNYQYEEGCCWGFIKIILTLLCIESDQSRPELDRILNNFFPVFSDEIILHIASFLDPLSTIACSRTCREARMIFSSSYWEHKCQQEKLQSWSRDTSPEKVYIANFWYKTQQLEMMKRAAAIGHPESKKKLQSIQTYTRRNEQQYKEYYFEPRTHFAYGYGKFPSMGYHHYY